MRGIMLPAEVWSTLVSDRPPYILDWNGIVQHEPLAKLLREEGFATPTARSQFAGHWPFGRRMLKPDR